MLIRLVLGAPSHFAFGCLLQGVELLLILLEQRGIYVIIIIIIIMV
jgi:hypothetical protein